MAQNVTIAGASYSDVPSISVPKTGGGTASFTDVTDTTAIASDVASGKYFYTAAGARTVGTGSGGSAVLTTKTITANDTYDAEDDNADGYSSVTVAIPNPFTITDVSNTTGTTAAVTAGGGGSATQHVISLEFSDSTDTDINLYYNDPLLTTMITAFIPPTQYGNKTVVIAELDGVEWYNGTETWETLYDGTQSINDGAFWITQLSDVHPTENSVWRITIDDVSYRCVAVAKENQWGGTDILIGNASLVESREYPGPFSDEPFAFANFDYGAWNGWGEYADGIHTVKIERLETS